MQPRSPKLIGLTGFAGAGKSTCADILVRNYGFVKLKFASPLKDMLRALGLSEDEIEGDLKFQPCDKLCGHTPRHAMQTLGTEWGRNCISPSLWIRAFERQAQELLDEGMSVVCDDLRFLNEASTIRHLKGKICRVVKMAGSAGCEDTHPSEQEQLCISIDHYIKNDATIEVLHLQVEELINLWETF
jgi:hypothetical protein